MQRLISALIPDEADRRGRADPRSGLIEPGSHLGFLDYNRLQTGAWGRAQRQYGTISEESSIPNFPHFEFRQARRLAERLSWRRRLSRWSACQPIDLVGIRRFSNPSPRGEDRLFRAGERLSPAERVSDKVVRIIVKLHGLRGTA